MVCGRAERKDTNSDATMLTWQVGTNYQPTDKVTFECAVTWYDFLDLEDMPGDADDLTDTETFLGYNNRHSQQMILDEDNNLVNDFQCLEIGAKMTVKDVLCAPFSAD